MKFAGKKWIPRAILSFILMAGLMLRIWIATSPGYEFDVGVNQGWGRSAIEIGLARSYVEQVSGNMLPNYPPFSLMIFAAAEYAYQKIFSQDFATQLVFHRIMIKLPAILADIGTAIVFYFLFRRWRSRQSGILAAAFYTFHPVVLYDSAYWGQTDSIFTFFMTAAIALFAAGWMSLAGALIALALFTKVQTVMLGLFFLTIAILAGWKNFLKVCAGALPVGILVLLPFLLEGNVWTPINVMTASVGYYSIVSSAAYNFWWTLLGDTAGSTPDTTLLFGVMSYRHVGFLIFGIANVFTTVLFWKRWRPFRQSRATVVTLYATASLLAFTFFFFSTQMHERYLFPFVALGLPVAFVNRRGAFLYISVCLFFLMNLMGWLPLGSFDRALFTTFPTLDVLIASCQLFAYISYVRYLTHLERRILPPVKHHALPAWIRLRLPKFATYLQRQ